MTTKTTVRQAPKTASQLAEMAGSLEPGRAWIELVALLRWQAAHGQRPGHVSQYLHAAYYKQRPREKVPLAVRDLVKTVLNGKLVETRP